MGDPDNPDLQVAWQDLPTATQPLQLLKVAFAGLTVGGPKQAIRRDASSMQAVLVQPCS